MFSEDLSELDDSRRVVQEVIEEYRASTERDYITRGTAVGLVSAITVCTILCSVHLQVTLVNLP